MMTKVEMIKQLLKENNNNPYIVIKEIIFNYHKYNYISRDECYNNLIFILEDFCKIQIDENELNNYLRVTNTDELNRMQQNKFKLKLYDKYKKCIITDNDIEECEACHIIPLEEKYSYDIDNGLLLSSSLHKLFDKFIWSINPITKCVEIKNNNKKYIINDYINKIVDLEDNVLKNLEWHYREFKKK